MEYGVFGPRDYRNEEYSDYGYISSSLSSFTDATKLYSGGSRGVERLVERFAAETNIPFQLVRPEIDKYGENTAFVVRNNEIILLSQSVIIFWDGTGARTVDILTYCMRVNKEVTLIPIK